MRRVGLVRHFRVTHVPERKWMTSAQFGRWIEQYDASEIDPNTRTTVRDCGIVWDVCLSSPQYRAVRTAQLLGAGPIVQTADLREIAMGAVARTNIRLHYGIWLVLARLAWLISHRSQGESRQATRERAKRFVESAERRYGDANVLIVSHGAFMRALVQELASRGYAGPSFLKPANGKLYVYEHNS